VIVTRFFDITFSILSLIFLMPLLLPIVLILKFSGEGEIFYLQQRIGLKGNSFNLIKFATMLKNSSNMKLGTMTIKNDPRILKIGGFLRNTKINELPQLLNVLKGDMSLIGPRPLTSMAFKAYSTDIQNLLKTSKPGLSGLGSIFFREEENILSLVDDPKKFHLTVIASHKGELEKWYVNNSSIYLYFCLIFLTVIVVFFPKTNLLNKFFKDMPLPPDELKRYLK
jgi:lipopolysaccharide/colanic/teichoic acid biosynthesis glycosyltransferase